MPLIGNLKGPKGDAGDAGPPGAPSVIPGPQGNPGTTGAPGTPGTQWFRGTTTPLNTVGVDGDYFVHDVTGDWLQKQGGVW